MSKSINCADFFKGANEDRPKIDNRDCQAYLNSKSIWNQFGLSANATSNYHRNTATTNDFAKLLADDEMTNIRLIDPNNKEHIEPFDKTINNRLQRFDFKYKKYDYSSVTLVEQISGEGYGRLKEYPLNLNNFYNIYIRNEFGNEQILCVLAFKK